MIQNVHIMIAEYNGSASRLVKETNSILNTGLVRELLVICKGNGHERKEGEVVVKTIKNDVILRSKNIVFETIRFLGFYLSIFKYLINKNVRFINVHSLHVLPIGVLLKIIKKNVVLIYDAHELETEVDGAKGLKKRAAKISERIFIRYVDKMIVVSDSIKKWYANEYKSINSDSIFVIRNIPNRKDEAPLSQDLFRKKFSISENELVFLYQGLISKVRGCEKIIRIFREISDKHIVFMGNGDGYLSEIKRFASEYDNIHYHEPVNFQKELPLYTSSADIGLHFIEVNGILNHRYCLPNKLFEYITNGLPVIVNSNAIEMTNIVRTYNAGFDLNTDSDDLSEEIEVIRGLNKQDVDKYKEGIDLAREELYWENDAKQYSIIYK